MRASNVWMTVAFLCVAALLWLWGINGDVVLPGEGQRADEVVLDSSSARHGGVAPVASRSVRIHVSGAITVINEDGEPVAGAGMWPESNKSRFLSMRDAMALSGPGGVMQIDPEIRRALGRNPVVIAAFGYVPLTCGACSDIADGSIFTLRRRPVTRFVVEHNGQGVAGVLVLASRSEFIGSDVRNQADLIPGAVAETAIVSGVTDSTGFVALQLEEGREYWVMAQKSGYVSLEGHPFRCAGGVSRRILLEKIVYACATVEADSILSDAASGMVQVPQCAAYLQELRRSLLESLPEDSLCYLGLAGAGAPVEMQVTIELSRQGRISRALKVRDLSQAIDPEVISFDASRVRPTGQVVFAIEGVAESGHHAWSRLPLMVIPQGRESRSPLSRYAITLGREVRLPFGEYKLGSILPVVRDAIDGQSVLVKVGEEAMTHSIQLRVPLRPVTFMMTRDSGVVIRRAAVTAKCLSELSDQLAVSQGAIDLAGMIIWLTDGVWEVRIRPAAGEELRGVLNFPRDWPARPMDGPHYIRELR